MALLAITAFGPTSYAVAEDVVSTLSEAETSVSPDAAADGEPPRVPDLSNTTIGYIVIVNENIFDLENPAENKALYRFANKIHIKTRPSVIESQLLFKSGDSYSKRVLDETERLLRSNRYMANAEITPTKVEDGVVDLEVRTTDVWTLSPSISFRRGGGENSGGIGLKEYNLLGYGTYLGVGYRTNVDRDSLSLELSDRNLFGSRNLIEFAYANNSDGYRYVFDLIRPFYSLDSTRSRGVLLSNGRSIESLYDRGEIVSRYELDTEMYEAFAGWSAGLRNGWVRRYTAGIVYDDHRFGAVEDDLLPLSPLPPDRHYVFPFIGVELVEDDFIEEKNVDQIGRVEDRNLGMRFSARIGYASEQFGSTADSWQLRSYFGKALYKSKGAILLLNSSLTGRFEDGEAQNAQFSIASRYDYRQSQKRLFHMRFSASAGHNLDVDNPVYLGGDNGLRGYPLRYQGGDSSFLFTAEQRFFTDWYPFRLFHVGGAIFFDAGRTWGEDPAGGEQLGWLRDVGIGLRIGNTRSGVGRMFHIDLAFPLDGEDDIDNVQILVEAKRGF